MELKLSYEEKKKLADLYLANICGLGWDDLSDINSLHDAETFEDIKALCRDRLCEESFPMDLLD